MTISCSSNRFEMPSFHAMSFFLFLRLFLRFTNDVGLENMLYYCETDEFPHPRPTQRKKKLGLKAALGAPLFPHSESFFSWVGDLFYIGKDTTTKTRPNQGSSICRGRIFPTDVCNVHQVNEMYTRAYDKPGPLSETTIS